MTGPDAFDSDAKTQPPDGQIRQVKEPIRRSERETIVRANGLQQTALLEQALKGGKGEPFLVGIHGSTEQQKAGGMIGNRQRIAVALAGQRELAFAVGAPQAVWAQAGRQRGAFATIAVVQAILLGSEFTEDSSLVATKWAVCGAAVSWRYCLIIITLA
jgi:hypothetical protein